MTIRNGFISNSGSRSFLVNKEALSNEELVELDRLISRARDHINEVEDISGDGHNSGEDYFEDVLVRDAYGVYLIEVRSVLNVSLTQYLEELGKDKNKIVGCA